MDDEIKAMLVKLLEGQNNADTMFVKLQEGLNRVEGEVSKNSIKLESIETKIDVVAEIQTAHKEQNEIAFIKSDSLTEEKVDLLGTSIKSVSKDVKVVKESIDVMKDVLGRNQIDIEILKRRPV
jgi:predicted  nucleic acid-binding Zn-ribbon protein